MADRTVDPHLFADLAATITTAIHDTPVRLGHPEGAADLAAQLTVKTAAYFGNVLPTTPGLAGFMAQVDRERARQLAKFGDQQHPDGTGSTSQQVAAGAARGRCMAAAEQGAVTWQLILDEEVREALAEADPARLRAELVQVAAVCQAWVSDLDRRPTAEDQPRRATCQHCRTHIQWIDCPTGGWWAHDNHPADDHDAEPPAAAQCDVEFVGGGHCTKPAGHRPPGSDDPHTP